MEQLVGIIKGMLFDRFGGELSVDKLLLAAIKLAPTIAEVVKDLSDGNRELSAENRLLIQEAIRELEITGGLK